jgi:RimJ/RimL family protein N-acetyltransferase
VTLTRGLTPATLAELWDWLRQFPAANFDDQGPKTRADFELEMARRQACGELFWTVEYGKRAVGVIGIAPISARLAMFHGVCFDRSVHGTGIASQAIRAVLDELFGQGFDKVSAAYFADNTRIHKLFQRLGARNEGYLRAHTVRAGKPLDMRLIAFFKEF